MSKPIAPSPRLAWPASLRMAHWALALASLGAAALAIFLIYAPATDSQRLSRYLAWIETHKLLGLLGLASLIWLAVQHRLRPARLGDPFARGLARIVQALLAGLVAVLAVSGYLGNSLFGNSLALPGLPPLPSPFAVNTEAGLVFAKIHSFCAYAFLAAAGLHVAAALAHHLILKDAALLRMLGFSGKADAAPQPSADP